uniref:Ig-like domain-containing protein n=1 Tax=Pavo cristatus TaxID=9049 RepID=A0A8C9L4X3_PAVCR
SLSPNIFGVILSHLPACFYPQASCQPQTFLSPSPGVGAQVYRDFKLQQPQGSVVMTRGETLTLNCTVSGLGPIGPVKWLKGWGSGNQTIYDQKGSLPPRVMRIVNESSTDFTIYIRDVRLEDAGTYYCVKFRRGTFGDEVLKSGGGTEVLVHAPPAQTLWMWLPQGNEAQRTEPRTSLTLGTHPRPSATSQHWGKWPRSSGMGGGLSRHPAVPHPKQPHTSPECQKRKAPIQGLFLQACRQQRSSCGCVNPSQPAALSCCASQQEQVLGELTTASAAALPRTHPTAMPGRG